MKATAIAPSNIALIKYWGKIDPALRLPENPSISMNLDNLSTTTTVEFNKDYKEDSVIFNGNKGSSAGDRIAEHLDRIRNLAGITSKAKVATVNNFPTASGIASSASGFAALTVAACAAAGLELNEKKLSILARLGSGSACRSIPDGFCEWLDGKTSETSYAVSLYPPDYWDIVDVVTIVSNTEKGTSSSVGQKSAQSSRFFPARLANIKNKIENIKKYLADRDFDAFGELIETEALELHAIMLTSDPALIYWMPGTVQTMRCIRKWRAEGLPAYFTIDAGANVHIIIEGKNLKTLLKKLETVEEIKEIVVNKPAKGTRLIGQPLF
jgi:diphosphomevalonate decarboxylase